MADLPPFKVEFRVPQQLPGGSQGRFAELAAATQHETSFLYFVNYCGSCGEDLRSISDTGDASHQQRCMEDAA
jgi:hypothetical protein